MNHIRSPYALLTLAMLGWSGNVLLGRAMRESFSPTSLSFWRWSVALALALPFIGAPLWRKRAVILRDWKQFLALGLLGVAAFNWLLYQAVEITTATNTALIYANTPIFIVALSWAWFGERIALRQGLGIALSSLGVVVVITRADLNVLMSLSFSTGDLWALSTVPVWGLYTILLRHRTAELTPFEFLGALMIIGWIGMLPLYAFQGLDGLLVEATLRNVTGVLYLAGVASLICFVLWNIGVAGAGANKAGLFAHLYPLFATVLAVAFLGEELRLFHLFGGGLIFAGLMLTTRLAPQPVPQEAAG